MSVVATICFLLPGCALVLGVFAWYTRGTARRIEQALPPLGRLIEVNGQQLHVRDQGSGAPLVLLHGLGGQMRHFDFGAMADLRHEFRVISVDRPGSGYSRRARHAPADLAAQARTLAALIRQLGLERPTVVGHSLGGAVALQLALDHPQAVGALALVAPLSHMPRRVPPVFAALAIRPRPLCALFAHALALPATVIGGGRLMKQVFGPEPVPGDFATRGGGLLALRPSQFLAAAADLQALNAHLPQLEARYRDLAVPLSVLHGRGDWLLDWRANGEQLVRQVAGARLELVDGAGHMLPITQPARTAAFIAAAAAAAAATATTAAPAAAARPAA
jgi:pimeloyl-ACP methyl ester carboxylesterase